MKNFINKIKEYMGRKADVSLKFGIITIAAALLFSVIAFNIGGSQKLDMLVNREASEQTSNFIKLNEAVTNESKTSLSKEKEALEREISEKSASQTAMTEYKSSKENYTKQISQLTSDVSKLDSSIQSKQTTLNEKKAAREAAEKERQRIAAEEKKAAEAKKVVESSGSGEMVWIGETGNKYHYKDCRTLRGNKYQISLSAARAQGRTACKVCH